MEWDSGGGCYALIWQQLRGNILEKMKYYVEFTNSFFSWSIYIIK
jgi:hypothetical protein